MLKPFSLLALLFSLFIFVYFIYFGLTNDPLLGDSHDYHIPIAQSYLNGQIFSVPKNANSFINSPGASEAFLVPFLLFQRSPNFFCFLGWILLFISLKKLGNHFGLNNYISIIFATSFTSILSLLRQIPTQSIDVWMAVWFVWLMILLEKQKKSLKYFLLLGLIFGFLVGSKYSGPGYMIVLLAFYSRSLLKVISFQRIIVFLIPFSVIGLFWYVRNFIAWGTPIYPGSIFMFVGIPTLDLPQWMLWKLLLQGQIYSLLQAVVSEYLIWAFSPIVATIYLAAQIRNKSFTVSDTITRLIILGFFVFIASLPLSFKPHFEISNVRYLYPLLIPFILSTFLIAKRYKMEKEIAFVALLNAFFAVSYIIYHPKLVIIYFCIVGVLYLKRKSIIPRLLAV